MPTITIRVSEPEKAALERKALAEGQNVSDYVRATLVLRENGPDFAAMLDAHEHRITRLEHIATLG